MRPLEHIRVVEFATVGGLPFCGWLLAQQGAELTRVVPPQARELGVPVAAAGDIGRWHRSEQVLDLKTGAGREQALQLVSQSDVLLEGFRPGVMERLGLGPQECHARTPNLVYGRLVGWPRDGAWSQVAGHDINYIAMAGALYAAGPERVPLNLVGDIAGGALYLAFGIAAALHARSAGKRGCVVDTAMTEGAAHLLSAVFGRLGVDSWNDAPAANVIDGGVPWYRSYCTADGRHMAVGAIEERFYLNFLDVLGLDPSAIPPRTERSRWPELEALIAARFLAAGFDHWCARFEGKNACVTPVLTLHEARLHPVTGTAFAEQNGIPLPRPVPRFHQA